MARRATSCWLCLIAAAAAALLGLQAAGRTRALRAQAGPMAPVRPVGQQTDAGTIAGISYETRWFQQLTDHFSWANQDTFKQRYLVNRDHWCGQNCPILFYCGNEGDIELFTNNTGWMWENAAGLHAMLVFAEHRFYGQSLPYPLDEHRISPNETKTLGYLSSEQALADYARLIYAIRNELYDAKHSPVIAVGGSYGGMLAAWLRMKYPNAVAGALAASAPILQFPGQYDCSQFTQIVTRDFESYSSNCSRSIARSWQVMRDLAAGRPDGLQRLSRAFNLCRPLADQSQLEGLLQLLNGVWVNMAMTDYANAATFLSRMPAHPVRHACQQLRREPLELAEWQLVRAVSRAAQVYTNFTGQLGCLDIEASLYEPMDVLWDFQSCTEMVMPICSDGLRDMFEPQPFNLSSLVQECGRRWGVRTQPHKVATLYGAAGVEAASNIIFSTCSRDPWSAGCPQEGRPAAGVHAIKIEGACHHEDLRPAGPNDSDALKAARLQEVNIVSDWIRKHYRGVKEWAANVSVV